MFSGWAAPVILCARTGLGTINHTLLSVEALRHRDMTLHGLIFIGEDNPETMRTIADLSGALVSRSCAAIWMYRPCRIAGRFCAEISERGFCMSHSPIWHPFTQHALFQIRFLSTAPKALIFMRRMDERIIDAISSWWVNIHGHNHPKIVAAVQAQAGRLDQIIFAGFTHEPAERVGGEDQSRLTPPNLTRVFFSDSGSTAVEVALKMALGYWAHKGRARRGVVALEHAYHGDTFGAMSVGSRGVFNAPYEKFSV